MKALERPRVGCKIYATKEHMTMQENELIGTCIEVNGNLCHFKNESGNDLFIWRFLRENKLNTWVRYEK